MVAGCLLTDCRKRTGNEKAAVSYKKWSSVLNGCKRHPIKAQALLRDVYYNFKKINRFAKLMQKY